ncbi:MAG: glycosyltransferase family 4 protein [Caldilineaceae bacterium]
MIPNFVDTDFMQPGVKENEFAQTHRLADKFVVLYAGNIGLTQGFETILEAAQRLAHLPDLRFVIVGDGTRRSWLEAQLASGGYANVQLLPYQPRSRVPQIYAAADLCLVPLKKGTAQETFPSKIYTIMAGRAVVAAADPDSELAWVVEQAQCGWSIAPDNAAALAQTIAAAYVARPQLVWQGSTGAAMRAPAPLRRRYPAI